VRTARRSADNGASYRQSSCDARALRASFCEDESQCVTSCDSHTTPATKLLVSQQRSDRGACGFVLTGYTEITQIWCIFEDRKERRRYSRNNLLGSILLAH
jgi:hypothetical protein